MAYTSNAAHTSSVAVQPKKNNHTVDRTYRVCETEATHIALHTDAQVVLLLRDMDVLCEVTICKCSAGARYDLKQKSIILCSSNAE